MTDRQFGFLLKMASEGYVDTHSFSKAAAVPVQPVQPVQPPATPPAPAAQVPPAPAPAAVAGAPAAAPAADAAPVTAERPVYKDERGRVDMNKYREWYRKKAIQEAEKRKAEQLDLYKAKLREDEEYYRTRGIHNRNVEAAKEGKPNPPPPADPATPADLWHNSSVDLGSVKDPYGGRGGTVERVQAIRDAQAARKAQEAVDFGQPSDKPLFNTEGQPTEPSPESVAPARTERATQEQPAPAYAPTPQMARITRSFDALPQREQFRMLSEAGIDLNEYLMATDEERDGMIRAAVIADARLRGTIRRR